MHQPSTDAPHDRIQTCAAMTATSDPVANWASLFSTAKCNSFDPQTAVEGLSLVIPNANRAWFWQTCLEFGWLKPSYPGTSIFWGEVTLENLLAGCQAVFGIPNMTPYDRPLDDDSLRARADDAPIADSDTDWTNTFLWWLQPARLQHHVQQRPQGFVFIAISVIVGRTLFVVANSCRSIDRDIFRPLALGVDQLQCTGTIERAGRHVQRRPLRDLDRCHAAGPAVSHCRSPDDHHVLEQCLAA